MAKIFVSYDRDDLNFVQGFVQTLMSNGVDIWWDKSALQGGDHWQDDIEQAIENCEIYMVILSPNSIKSDWVQKEYTCAMDRNKHIIPVLYQACKVPIALIDINYIDIQGSNYEKGINDIVKLVSTGPQDKQQILQPAHDNSAPVNPVNVANAPSGIFTNIWVEHNVVWGMFMGMRIHASAVVRGQANNPCKAVVHFFGYNNQPLIDVNANPMYRTVDGFVSTAVDFIPMYPETNFPDLVMYIPYNELHLMPGMHQLAFRISFFDMTRNFIFAQSFPQPFMVTQ